MEKTAKKLAEKIGNSLNYDSEQKAVMAYGLIGLSQFFIILILTSVIGFIFGFFIESLIIFISVGLLRRTIGGAHSSDFYSCIIVSVFFVTLLASACKYLLGRFGFVPLTAGIAAIYMLAFFLTYKLAPVASPNKPIRTPAKRKRLRKNAFIVLALFVAASIFPLAIATDGREFLKSYCAALALSVLWQVSLMTKAGHRFMEILDGIFFGIKKKCSGK